MQCQARRVVSALPPLLRTSIACIRKDTLRWCRSANTSMAGDNTDGKKIAMSKRGGSVWEYMVQHSMRGNPHLAKLEEVHLWRSRCMTNSIALGDASQSAKSQHCPMFMCVRIEAAELLWRPVSDTATVVGH